MCLAPRSQSKRHGEAMILPAPLPPTPSPPPPESCFSVGGVCENSNCQLNGIWYLLEERPLGMPGRGVVILWVGPPPSWDPGLYKRREGA